ncbi:MAG: spermidine synthase [Verrucomicrobia bacterium ADurb.Bin345]|nr:MAG: spermidine synthase [Verrucomicrobia bacterium ADurb.Bin345]
MHLIAQDGRFFLNHLAGSPTYDVMIFNLPNPSTILINRLYTEEAFRLARTLLKPGGLLSTHLAFSPDYLSPELENLGASLYRTLTAVFDSVIVLPEYTAFYIASADRPLELDPKPLISRFVERAIATSYISVPYLEYRLTTDRIEQVLTAFKANRTAVANRDTRPIACYYNLVHWISSLHPRAAQAMAVAGRAKPRHIAAALSAFFAIMLLRLRRAPGGASLWAMAVASFTLMACEVAIILGFQIFYGYLYYRISLIIACLMLGMAAGSWAAVQVQPGIRSSTLMKLHAELALYAALLIPLFGVLAPAMQRNALVVQVLFLAMAALLGGFVGFEYAAVTTLYLAAHHDDHRRTGWVYAVDIIGSCAGSLLISMWLLPVVGLPPILTALCALNILTAAALWAGNSGH